mgnify:CR=1 FL=1
MLTIDDRELQAAVLAFRLADRGLRNRINDSTREQFNGPWRAGIAAAADTQLERRVLVPGARIAAGNPPVFVAAGSRRPLSGGLVPDTQWAGVEFGADDTVTSYTRRSPKGTVHRVTRHTRRQLPRRRKHGPVFTTVSEFSPRAASLWAQIIVRVYVDAAAGRA